METTQIGIDSARFVCIRRMRLDRRIYRLDAEDVSRELYRFLVLIKINVPHGDRQYPWEVCQFI